MDKRFGLLNHSNISMVFKIKAVMTPLSLPQFIKGPPHTCEKFCIQTWTSKLLKDMDLFDLKMTEKKLIFKEKINFLNYT